MVHVAIIRLITEILQEIHRVLDFNIMLSTQALHGKTLKKYQSLSSSQFL